MALPRYNPSEVTLQPGAASVAYNQQAQSWNNLSQKLDQWSNIAYNRLATQKEEEATQQAYKDDLEGKAFHKENVYTVYGQAYNNARTASYAARTELDLVEASTKYATQFKNDPISYEASMKGVLEGINKEVADPRLKSSISIYANKLIATQSSTIAAAAKKEADATQLAIYEQFKNQKTTELINAISSGDTKTADLLRHQLDEYTTTLMENGVLSDDKYVEDFADTQYKVARGSIEGVIQNAVNKGDLTTAEALEKEFTKQIPKDFTPEQHRATKSSIRSIISGARKEQRARAKELKELANEKVDEAIFVLKNGKVPENIPTSQTLRNSSPAKQKEFELLVKTNRQLDKFRNLPFKDQETEINKYIKSETASQTDIMVKEKLETIMKEKKANWTKDPITQGENENLYKDVVSIDINKPEEIAQNLAIRVRQSKINQEEVGNVAWKLLKENEVLDIKNKMNNPNTTIEEKQQIVSSFMSGGKDAAKLIFKQLGQNDLKDISFAGELSIRGKVDAAQIALLGSKTDIKVDIEKADISTKIGSTFRAASADTFNSVQSGIMNYIKGKKALGEDVTIDEAFEQTVGKIKEYNGQNVILPSNINETAFENWLDNIEIKDRPTLQKGLRDMTDTFYNGEYQLHYKDDGEYYIYNPNNGNGYYERASNDPESEDYNKPYILKYKRWGE